MTRLLRLRWRSARKTGTFDGSVAAFVCQTRRGDRGMCLRFWGGITRELFPCVCQGRRARAFHPKARSHAPITTPSASFQIENSKPKPEDKSQAAYPIQRHSHNSMSDLYPRNPTATSGVRWVSDAAWTWGFAKSRRRLGRSTSRRTFAESDTHRVLRVKAT